MLNLPSRPNKLSDKPAILCDIYNISKTKTNFFCINHICLISPPDLINCVANLPFCVIYISKTFHTSFFNHNTEVCIDLNNEETNSRVLQLFLPAKMFSKFCITLQMFANFLFFIIISFEKNLIHIFKSWPFKYNHEMLTHFLYIQTFGVKLIV